MLCGGQNTARRFDHGRPRDWLAGHVLDKLCARSDESMDHRLSFVAEKAAPCGAKALLMGTHAVHQITVRHRQCANCAVEERRHCLLQLGRAAMEAPSG